MAKVVVSGSDIVVLAGSLHGSGSTDTDVTFVVVGEGTLYIDTVQFATAADLRESGLPLSAGQVVDDSLTSGQSIYATAGDGEDVEVRILRRGAR